MNLHSHGYANVEIAETIGIHRNTMSNLRVKARELLGADVPGLVTDDLDIGLFNECARVMVYRKPGQQ